MLGNFLDLVKGIQGIIRTKFGDFKRKNHGSSLLYLFLGNKLQNIGFESSLLATDFI